MKNLKKIICLLISVIMVFSTLGVAAETSDYGNHWAKSSIDKLKEKGIVSGDSNGLIRPEDMITRAEFISVINKTFTYKEKANSNFSDVEADEWYYEEFLIAKKAGYIKGDDKGCVNPENPITRTEASVIIARIGKLVSNQNLNFHDEADIPSWGKKEVSVLVSKGIILGYEDNTFKPLNPIKRAEAFTIIVKVLDSDIMKETTSETDSNEGNIAEPTGGLTIGGSGGGSSTSSGNSSIKYASVPVVTYFDSVTSELKFTSSPNAKSYNIKIVYNEKEENVTEVLGTTINLSSAINKLTSDVLDDAVDIQVSVRANGKSGYRNSDYSTALKVTKKFQNIDAPVLFNKVIMGDEMISNVVTWSSVSHAKTYEIKGYIDDQPNDTFYWADTENRKIVVENTNIAKDKKVEIKVVAISDKTDNLKNSTPSIYTVVDGFDLIGEGTVENPFVIDSALAFEKISENLEANYVITRDLVLENRRIIGTFKGHITGDKTYGSDDKTAVDEVDKMPILYFNIDSQDASTAPFGIVSGEVSNLKIAGNIKGIAKVGGVASTLQSGKISNIINYANITGNNTVGGIAGGTSADVIIENCYNFGNITSKLLDKTNKGQNAGGISGYPSGATISKCGNYGNISGVSTIAGIAGASYAVIDSCFNVGDISVSGSVAGGIAGMMRFPGHTVKNSYSTGNVTGKDSGKLVSGPSAHANAGATIENCYVVGKPPFIALNSAKTTTTNCYYIDDTQTDDSFNGTTAITEEEAKATSNNKLVEIGFAFDGINPYPTLLSVPQVKSNDYKVFDTIKISKAELVKNTAEITFIKPSETEYTGAKVLAKIGSSDEIIEKTLGTDESKFGLENLPYIDVVNIIVTPLFGQIEGSPVIYTLYIGPNDTTSPAAVTDFAVLGGNTSAQLSWVNPTDEDFSKIKIQYREKGTTQYSDVDLEKTTSEYILDNLINGKTYEIAILTFDACDNFSSSEVKEITCGESVLPLPEVTDSTDINFVKVVAIV